MSGGTFESDSTLTDKQRAKLAPFLDPAEEVVVAVPAESGLSRLFILVSSFLRFFSKEWLVVRTDRRILLFRTRATLPRVLNAEYPLDARVQFTRKAAWFQLSLGGAQYRVSGVLRPDLEILTGQREPQRDKPKNLECISCGFLNYEDATQCAKCRVPFPPA